MRCALVRAVRGLLRVAHGLLQALAYFCQEPRRKVRCKCAPCARAKLRVNHVLALYARLKRASNRRDGTLSGRSVLHIHRMVYRICSWAERRELVETNVLRREPAPTPNESPARALAPEEAVTILHHAKGSRGYEFFVLAIATGARRGELAALRWEAVDLERCSITIHKSMGTDRRGGYYLKAPKSGPLRAARPGGDRRAARRACAPSEGEACCW